MFTIKKLSWTSDPGLLDKTVMNRPNRLISKMLGVTTNTALVHFLDLEHLWLMKVPTKKTTKTPKSDFIDTVREG